MTEEQSSANGAPYVQLFQKAHQKIVALDRVDEQIAQLLARRQESLEELRVLQAQINQELEGRINARGESAARVLAAVANAGAGAGAADIGSNVRNRFAAQSAPALSAVSANGADDEEEPGEDPTT